MIFVPLDQQQYFGYFVYCTAARGIIIISALFLKYLNPSDTDHAIRTENNLCNNLFKSV